MGKSHVQAFGLRELHRPAQEPEVDIVAVHGLNGDSIKSWTTESGDVCWLHHPDLLPKYVNRARILTWGYNANITTWTRKTTSSDRILQHSQTLIAELYADRDLENATERPLIFLCHSMGGIVVKRALAYSASRSSANLSHLQSIYNCTFGILFFGTPHNGSSQARLLSSLTKLASLAVPNAAGRFESGLVTALKEESETLQNITDQFVPLMSRFRIHFFWEQQRTDIKFTKDYIVDESSAAPILDNTERCGIAADHRGIIKFRTDTSQGFRTVMAALRRYSREAPQVIARRLSIAAEMSSMRREHEVMEMLTTIHPARTYPIAYKNENKFEAALQKSPTYLLTSESARQINAPPSSEILLLENSGYRGSFAEDFERCSTIGPPVGDAEDSKRGGFIEAVDSEEKKDRKEEVEGAEVIVGLNVDCSEKKQDGNFVPAGLRWINSFRSFGGKKSSFALGLV